MEISESIIPDILRDIAEKIKQGFTNSWNAHYFRDTYINYSWELQVKRLPEDKVTLKINFDNKLPNNKVYE